MVVLGGVLLLMPLGAQVVDARGHLEKTFSAYSRLQDEVKHSLADIHAVWQAAGTGLTLHTSLPRLTE